MGLVHQIVPHSAEPERNSSRNTKPAAPVTSNVTRGEFEALLKRVAALEERGPAKSENGRAAYMREYRKRKRAKV